MTANRAAKRVLDVTLVVASAPLFIPILAIATACVLIFDGHPAIYRQVRCGEGGRHFVLFKLRTMTAGKGASVTTATDPRVTRCGSVLRRLKVDELPQLWNVLVGNMSLVGPRPEMPSWVDRFPDEFRTVLSVPPGLTDFASVYFHDEAEVLHRLAAADPAMSTDSVYAAVVLPSKLELNRRYVERAGLLTDFALIVITLLTVIMRRVPVRFMTRLSSTPPPLCLLE
jgi:lipopolysaccharide/colanic/teichoic acid biosynthesis glycosyltransferase